MANPPAGLCLTFDDRFILSWYRALPLLEKYNAKATFFICWPHKMRWRDIRMLREIAAAGHEIGCHTYTHARLNKYLNHFGLDAYLDEQIDPAIKAMQDMGFPPTSFAYPYFRHRPHVTDELLKRFDVVRAASPYSGWGDHIVPPEGARVVNAYCMTDMTGMELPIDYFSSRFERLAQHGGYGVTCGHALGNTIPRNPSMTCSNEDLEIILALAKAHGFTFHTVTEMAPTAHVSLAKSA